MKNLIPHILYDLFAENKKISLAELGYFEIVHKSASYNAELKTLHPPRNIVFFKNSESQNDNLLTKKLAKHLNISEKESHERIADWINDICVQIAETGSAKLKNIGEFYVDDEGKIAFNFADGTNIAKDNYGLVDVKI